VNAEFQWWLLILGIVIGGALVYLVLADLQGDGDADEIDAVANEADLEADEPVADDRPLSDETWAESDQSTRWPAAPDSAPARAADPSAERGRASVGDDAAVQRDGAQRESPVTDLP
jgi:hypothetical protein